MNSSNTQMIIWSVELILAIIVAIIFASKVKSDIRKKEYFSGTAWGVLNGILGIGLLFVILAHSSINKELVKIKDKKYRDYAQQEMASFTKTYIIFLVIWFIISMILSATTAPTA